MLQRNIKLRKVREELKMSQKEVAEWLNWPSHTNVSNYETGKQKGLPDEYLDFLISHHVDLNSFFNPADIDIKFIKEPSLELNEDQATYEATSHKEQMNNQSDSIRDKTIYNLSVTNQTCTNNAARLITLLEKQEKVNSDVHEEIEKGDHAIRAEFQELLAKFLSSPVEFQSQSEALLAIHKEMRDIQNQTLVNGK